VDHTRGSRVLVAWGESPRRRAKVSSDALLPGCHSCCHTRSRMSVCGSNLLAKYGYSLVRPSRRPVSAFANAASRAICASCALSRLRLRTQFRSSGCRNQRERVYARIGFDGFADSAAIRPHTARPTAGVGPSGCLAGHRRPGCGARPGALEVVPTPTVAAVLLDVSGLVSHTGGLMPRPRVDMAEGERCSQMLPLRRAT
jgi:hypothetical protein